MTKTIPDILLLQVINTFQTLIWKVGSQKGRYVIQAS